MPKLVNLENNAIPNNHYGFSAQRIGDLGSTEYTLVSIVVDDSGSVNSFARDMEKCLKEVVKACKHSPRADYLMIRLVKFDHDMSEVHGFKLLGDVNVDDYDNILKCGGSTALYDAAENAILATSAYGKQLVDNDLSVNGIVVVITDGEDNASTATINSCKQALQDAVRGENLESLVSILVGVNVTDKIVSRYLNNFNQDAGFSQYVELDNANEKTLAKLAAFVSKSISSQSQALGSGGASKSLTF